MNTLPKVIIIGRANVGKSTLFNRLIEEPKALTSEMAGTTRDINVGQIYWQGINFEIADTGGIDTIIPSKKLKSLSPQANINFALDIIKKTQVALKQADLILFLVDIKAGLLPQDKALAAAIKKIKKPIIFAANKTDSINLRNNVADFFKLGLGEPHYVSGKNGAGTGDLLDVITTQLKRVKKARQANKFSIPNPLRITIIGKPNVGKSSILNALLGQERAIVSPLPFTTREAIDTYLQYKGQNIILVDTAGIRKQARINPGLEKISVRKSMSNAKNSDICFLVLDISSPMTVQDNKLSKILIDAKTSIIIIANKWDLIPEKDTKTQKKFIQYIYNQFPYLSWVPIIFISALTKKNVHNILDLALQINKNRNIQLSDEQLEIFLQQAIRKQKPLKDKGQRHPQITGMKQIKTNPPSFNLHLKQNDNLSSAYLRYLENSLREKFNLQGTPLRLNIK